MSRTKFARLAVPGLALLIVAAIVVPAVAQPSASARVRLTAIGGVTFKPNRYIQDNMRFNKNSISADRGDTIVLNDRTRQPHTFSVVRRGQVPRRVRQIDACFEGGPCGELFVKHGAVNPDTGEEQEPTTPLVNAGREGFNQPGDSVLIPPNGRATVRVTGSRDMYYICAIHPWMQGKVDL
jgi:plastocyanin